MTSHRNVNGLSVKELCGRGQGAMYIQLRDYVSDEIWFDLKRYCAYLDLEMNHLVGNMTMEMGLVDAEVWNNWVRADEAVRAAARIKNQVGTP